MHGYVVPSRIGTLACTTLQLEFSVYSGKKNDVKKYVNNLELINKDKKKKKCRTTAARWLKRTVLFLRPGFQDGNGNIVHKHSATAA